MPAIDLADLDSFEANDRLHNVRDLAVARDGHVWAVGGLEPFLHRYSPDGSLVESTGRAGGGPGELRYPQGLSIDGAGHLEVWDQGRRQLLYFTGAGEYAGRYATLELGTAPVLADLELLSYGRGRILRPWGDGYLLQEPTDQVSSTRGVSQSVLLVLAETGEVVDTLVDFRDLSAPAHDVLAGAREFVPIPLWTVCPSGHAAVLDPYRSRLIWFADGSSESRTDSIDIPVRPVTDEDIRRWLVHSLELETTQQGIRMDSAQQAQLLTRILESGRGRFGTSTPPAVAMLCDSEDRLWLQQFGTGDDPRGFGREWIVFRSGRTEARYRFPPRFQPFIIRDGRALGVSRDLLDVESVASVPLPDHVGAPMR